ncbi:RHS repeat-associated core domain-containing protein [Chitinimonas sp. PSY-7]|uniref:RHS repeat-associated core domain-containing protein n=1 Tax=Chitinimonas sp. PSY-7 TaxID=3459088 RepID=UPI00403FD73B
MQNNAAGNIYSNAFNFSSFVTTGVDPRTGLYTCSLSLGEIQSAALNGPTLPVALSFNPLGGDDAGLGIGWSIALTRYDRIAKVFTLSTGERFKAVETSDGLRLTDQKLNFFRVQKHATGYRVIHKNGTIEELSFQAGSHIALPVRVVAANGVAISLGYTQYGGQPALADIKDHQRTLLTIDRTSISNVTITLYPGSASQAVFRMGLNNQLVTMLNLPDNAGQWAFQYEIRGGCQVITRVQSPAGALETLQYKEDGHQLPPGAPVNHLPYVISHIVAPGQGQPSMEKRYQYSDRNFLGFGALSSWSNDGDNLYLINTQYEYTSTEHTYLDGKSFIFTVRTYNHFHLQTAEVTRCGTTEKSTLTTYPLIPGKHFNDQPAQCQLPRQRTVQYRDETAREPRKDVLQTEFDEYGNLLKQIEETGITTEHTYYPATGGTGCPADPFGFVRSLKLTRTLPAATGDLTPAPAKETRYQYQQLQALNGQGVHLVRTRQETYELQVAQTVPLTVVCYQYLQAPTDAAMHGRLLQHQLTLKGSGGDYSTTTQHSYLVAQDELTLTATLTGYDGQTSTQCRTVSALNGLEREVQNADGMHLTYRHDALGRIVTEVSAPGTAYEAARRYVYTTATDSAPAQMTTTDVNGTQVRHEYDGLGRVVRVLREDIDSGGQAAGTWRLTEETQHNALGQVSQVTEIDWIEGTAIRVGRQLTYDGWGNPLSTLHDNGVREYAEVDPIGRSVTHWLAGQGKTATRHNVFDKPVEVTRLDLQGKTVSKTLYAYDGFGRTIKQVDAAGNETRYTYDAFDRLTSTRLPDGIEVESTYAMHTMEAQPVLIRLDGSVAGEQTFDGLGRLIARTVGGRRHTFQYQGSAPKPARQQTPQGVTIDYQYQPDLEFALTRRTTAGLDDSFQYQTRSAQLTESIAEGQTRRREYYPSGLLRAEHVDALGKLATSHYRYSLGGKPLGYTGIAGDEQVTGYDSYGRPASYQAGSLRTTVAYDAHSRPSKVQVKDQATDLMLTTSLQYDDFGREVQRVIEVPRQATQTLTLEYTSTDKLARRLLKSGNTIERDETFDYDTRGRLVSYQCLGQSQPTDSAGKKILRQVFVFDAWDNIVRMETEFPGGRNIASFAYAAEDPTQLTSVSNSHADYPVSVQFSYDAAGNLLNDEHGRQLRYDTLGRLQEVVAGNADVCRYGYDANDALVVQSLADGTARHLYYRDERIAHERVGKDLVSVLQLADQCLAQRNDSNASQTLLLGTDRQQSVLSVVGSTGRQLLAYTPYGDQPSASSLSLLLGFNGERIDPVTGWYLLGNGYRAYNPGLMRFHSPDSWSPFEGGGLNPYAYCQGDPINFVDPTGHLNWKAILGIVLGAVGIVVAVASLGTGAAISAGLISAGAGLTAFAATGYVSAGLALAGIAAGATGIASAALSEKDPHTSNILGWVSLGLGVGSSVLGGLSAGIGSGISTTTRVWAAGMATSGLLAGGADAASKLLVDVSPLASEILSWVSLGLGAGALVVGGATTIRQGRVSGQYTAGHFPDAGTSMGHAGTYRPRSNSAPAVRGLPTEAGATVSQLFGAVRQIASAPPTEFRRIRSLSFG